MTDITSPALNAHIDLDALERTPLQRDPYDFTIVENFIHPDALKAVIADFPKVPGPGSHPPSVLDIHGHFGALMDEMMGDDFRHAVARKFGVDLEGRPAMYTVRGYVRDTDGSIHTDTKTKIITVLLYLNEGWDEGGGRLRILRSGTDIENYVAEVSPFAGTLLIFRRADNSWHGHLPFGGQRRAIQLNWVVSQDVVDKEQRRHHISSTFKKIKHAILGA